MIKLLINEQEVKFETTIFPDGTSQVWKLQNHIPFDPRDEDPVILWLFENEAELMHVLQLAALVQTHLNVSECILRVPYLPYGRQDKGVSNKASFALHVFADTLYRAGITRIETFDPHSLASDIVYADSIMPTVQEFHESILNHNIICFPDKGAADRYGKSVAFRNCSIIYCAKVRNQATGEILGLDLVGKEDDLIALNSGDILIVDDICDGGMTFIKVVEAIEKCATPRTIDLAVSHGLFSKGLEVLHDAGISRIYTTNSLLRNPEGFKVW